jgi:hypothetical protein
MPLPWPLAAPPVVQLIFPKDLASFIEGPLLLDIIGSGSAIVGCGTDAGAWAGVVLEGIAGADGVSAENMDCTAE